MSDFDPSSLPAAPHLQLRPPGLTLPGLQPPSPTLLPPFGEGSSWGGAGGGSPAAMTDLFGHLTDGPLIGAATPGAPNIFAPIPAAPANQLHLDGLGPISGAVNPWLADPMRVAGDAQRQLDLLPRVDPGLAQQQTIVHAPQITF